MADRPARLPPGLRVYLALSAAAGPAAPLLLRRRAARGREDPARLAERFGRPAVPRPEGRLVWLHGASLGEGLSMLPLIDALRAAEPRLGILATTGTVSSARRLGALLPERAVHQFVPVDTRGAVRGFLDHWRPDLAVWIESELWPRLMAETAARGTPMMLVNARLSAASRRAWGRAPATARWLVRRFGAILTQDRATAERLVALGADPARVEEAGNLKVALPPPPADAGVLAHLRAATGGRPVWLAASTHAPEEAAVAEAHRAAGLALSGLLTVLAPRHPERGEEIAAALRRAGLRVERRTDAPLPDARTQVYLADTLGEMGLWLRLAPVAFVGGSIAPMGGHNPFEAAALGAAVLHGGHTENFAPSYAALTEAGAAREVRDGAEIAAALRALLPAEGGAARAAMVAAAREVRARMTPDVAAIAARALRLMERRP
ncbi:MAG TPA: 3-deoxy-D-manno-octulosonic acid transferase [Thermohalobaculum sp.]|nr:3-deoxy-D-manno-octulosonic acid transferase [Thermohalobaculum sp.]